MAKSSTTTNPFHYLYAGISGREDSHYNLRVYFPHSITYKHTPREIRVRRDVSVEEVIGHALWSFWEDKALPALDDPETIPEGVDRKVRLSSAGWCLRIVEEDTDGEVDEDYPGAYFSLTLMIVEKLISAIYLHPMIFIQSLDAVDQYQAGSSTSLLSVKRQTHRVSL